MENYKYNIEKILDSLSKSDHDKKLREIMEVTGLSYHRIYQIRQFTKTDKGTARPETLIKIADCLGVTLKDLLSDDATIKQDLVTIIEYKGSRP